MGKSTGASGALGKQPLHRATRLALVLRTDRPFERIFLGSRPRLAGRLAIVTLHSEMGAAGRRGVQSVTVATKGPPFPESSRAPTLPARRPSLRSWRWATCTCSRRGRVRKGAAASSEMSRLTGSAASKRGHTCHSYPRRRTPR